MNSSRRQNTSGRTRIGPYAAGHDQPLIYTSVDPFRPSIVSSGMHLGPATNLDIQPTSPAVHPSPRPVATMTYVLWMFFDMLPRQLYLHFLFRLPAFYFSRVALIFDEAEMTLSEIRQMAPDHITYQEPLDGYGFSIQHTNPLKLNQLRATWAAFIDSLLMEWKTLNIVSVLLLSAILTLLQIEGAATDPIARHAALLSLICALMSLLYGCMYIIRFGGMKGARKAVKWATEGQKKKTNILWNEWVLLAMPATWLAWSLVLYVVCVMTFVWRTGSAPATHSFSPLSPHAQLGLRITISAVLALGIVYMILILHTFRRYGDAKKAWGARVDSWQAERQQRRIPPVMFSQKPPVVPPLIARDPGPKKSKPYRGGVPPTSAAVGSQQQPSYARWLPPGFDSERRLQVDQRPQANAHPVIAVPVPATRPAHKGRRHP